MSYSKIEFRNIIKYVTKYNYEIRYYYSIFFLLGPDYDNKLVNLIHNDSIYIPNISG